MIALSFSILSAIFYSVGAIRQWATLNGKKKENRALLLGVAMVGAIAHATSLSQTLFIDHRINLAMFEVGSLISLVIVSLLIFSSWRKPVDNLFIGLLPMAALICLSATLSDKQELMHHLSYSMVWHILLAILAFSLFNIASVQAILVIIQDNFLRKRKTRGLIQALPPLQTMDVLLFELIWLGMILLTTAFAVGWPAVIDLKTQHLIHKVVFASIAWLVFAILLFGRYRFGWRGPLASRWTLTGMGFLILSYFGSEFVLEYLIG